MSAFNPRNYHCFLLSAGWVRKKERLQAGSLALKTKVKKMLSLVK